MGFTIPTSVRTSRSTSRASATGTHMARPRPRVLVESASQLVDRARRPPQRQISLRQSSTSNSASIPAPVTLQQHRRKLAGRLGVFVPINGNHVHHGRPVAAASRCVTRLRFRSEGRSEGCSSTRIRTGYRTRRGSRARGSRGRRPGEDRRLTRPRGRVEPGTSRRRRSPRARRPSPMPPATSIRL